MLEEAQYGKLKEILFPAFIEDVEFPYGFGRIQTADLIGWAGDEGHHGLAGVLESLKEHLNSREATPGSGDVLHVEGVVISKPVQPALAQTFSDADGPLMVVIPAGRFRMGSPADEPERTDYQGPQHEVGIAASFAMGVYAVTFYDYERFCDDTKLGKPEDQGWGRSRRPVIHVSWKAARDYCAWLGEQTGRIYRLSSEAGVRLPGRHGYAVLLRPTYHHGPVQLQWQLYLQRLRQGRIPNRAQTVAVACFAPNAFALYAGGAGSDHLPVAAARQAFLGSVRVEF